MKLVRLSALAIALALCPEAGGQEPHERSPLPPEVEEAIKRTPCPSASGLSPEACLLWLTPDQQTLDSASRAAIALDGDHDNQGAPATQDAPAEPSSNEDVPAPRQ